MTVYRKTFASHLKQFRLICFYLTSYTEQFRSQSKKKNTLYQKKNFCLQTQQIGLALFTTPHKMTNISRPTSLATIVNLSHFKNQCYISLLQQIFSLFFQNRSGRSFLVMCLLQLPLAIIRVVVIYLYQYSAGRKPHKNIFLFTLQKYGIHA